MKQHHFIKAWRKHCGLTLQQVADRIEKDKATVSKIENFKIGYTQESLEAIAFALGRNIEAVDLLSPPPDPKTPENDLTRHLRKIKSKEDRARLSRMLAAFLNDDVA